MTRYIFFTLSALLLLSACASDPDTRPHGEVQAAKLMEEGNTAFDDDNYLLAIDQFNDALFTYRSFDDRAGANLARLNLAQAALMIGKLELASAQLDALEKSADTALRPRIALLRATLAYRWGDLAGSVVALEPIFQPGIVVEPLQREQALASRTQLAYARKEPDAEQWLTRYLQATEKAEPRSATAARRLRLQATAATAAGEPERAEGLLEQSLAIYRASTDRPSVAATLEALASISIAQGHSAAAAERLQRALAARIWYQDVLGIAADLEQLASIDEGRSERLKFWAGEVRVAHFNAWLRLRRELGL